MILIQFDKIIYCHSLVFKGVTCTIRTNLISAALCIKHYEYMYVPALIISNGLHIYVATLKTLCSCSRYVRMYYICPGEKCMLNKCRFFYQV